MTKVNITETTENVCKVEIQYMDGDISRTHIFVCNKSQVTYVLTEELRKLGL